jgi:hypothetical protein
MKMLMDYATVVRNCGPVPPAVFDAVRRYVEEGIPPGGFVLACLENDLMAAINRADPANRECLQEIMWMIYSAMPSTAHGSPDKVRLWLDGGWKKTDIRFERYTDHHEIERAD